MSTSTNKTIGKFTPIKYVGEKFFSFSPLLFLTWEYFNTGSLMTSVITCCRDFMWPAAVVTATYMNASPY